MFGHAIDSEPAALLTALRLYTAVTADGWDCALLCSRIRKLPLLNQILALSVCAVLLPPVSFDYTLVHLLVPVGLLCLYTAPMPWRAVAGLRLCLVCFALIFNVDAFVSLHWRLAGEFRAVVLVVLLVCGGEATGLFGLRGMMPCRGESVRVWLRGLKPALGWGWECPGWSF